MAKDYQKEQAKDVVKTNEICLKCKKGRIVEYTWESC